MLINEHNTSAMPILTEKVRSYEPLLIDEFRRGKNAAFQQIFRKYHKAICNYARVFIGDPESAKDIASDAFISLWLNRLTINSESAIRSFLYACAKNACRNYLRRTYFVHNRHTMVSRDLLTEQWGDPVTAGILHVEDLHRVNSTIDKLARQCRRVLKLTLEGLNTRDIATVMGLSRQTVINTKIRATAQLKNRLLQES